MDIAGLALLIVAGAVLIVIIFFFAYFNTLMLIASFTYPNAKMKATGIQFIQAERLKKLVESGTREEFVEALRAGGYAISSGETDVDALESAVEREGMEIMKSTLFSLPKGAKPFFEAYMMRYDAEAIKRVIRAKISGRKLSPAEIPVHSLDRRIIEEMMDAGSVEDAKNALHGTIFSGAANEQDGLSFESALDRIVFQRMQDAVSSVDGDIAKKISVFVGVMIDVTNIKAVLRAKSMGLKADEILSLRVGEGREVAEWRLKNMAEAQDIISAISELSGTQYSDSVRGLSTVEDVERALDQHLLKRASQLGMEASLDVGPAIHFFVAKEMEMRNLRAINLAIENKMSWDEVEGLMITEVAA